MNVLYIDDDLDDSEIFLEAIKKIDQIHNCTVAHTGADAIKLVSDNCPDYIFLDYLMPKMDGVKVLVEIKKSECRAKVIMYSDFSQQAYLDECREKGAYDCWQKLTSIEDLRSKLQTLFVANC